jgi:hypothetical protein
MSGAILDSLQTTLGNDPSSLCPKKLKYLNWLQPRNYTIKKLSPQKNVLDASILLPSIFSYFGGKYLFQNSPLNNYCLFLLGCCIVFA